QRLEGRSFVGIALKRPARIAGRWIRGRTVLLDHTGEWWLASSEGLVRTRALPFGPALANAAPRATYGEKDGLAGRDVSALFEARSGAIWVGLYDSERPLARLDRQTGRFHAFGSADGLPPGAPLAFAEDAAGDLWIGMGPAGAVRLRNGAFERLTP